MSNHKVTIEQLPSGKYACFLHIEGKSDPIHLGKEFKDEERAENWLNVSESVTAIEMMLRKHTAQA
jgi:hypothetical protein